jgi:L-fuculose-phosphate aldolase
MEIASSTEMLPEIGLVPVLGWGMEVAPGGLADIIARALKEHRIVMVYGHGSFAIGQLLEEAHSFTTALEASCQVSCLLKSLKVDSARGG